MMEVSDHAGMEKTYRLVLSRSDTALVAWSDPEELETVTPASRRWAPSSRA